MDLHIDASMGIAGDMLLAALLDAGADEATVGAAIRAVAPEATIDTSVVLRCGMRAQHLRVFATDTHAHRRWATIRTDLERAELPETTRGAALRAFGALAAAEARVHDIAEDEVHFHEVGAVDSIADVVGVCAAISSLAPRRITCGPVATGSGSVATEHGRLPVPAPAVVELFAGSGATILPGPARFEACTPTAAALLVAVVDEWTAGPALSVARLGAGAGSADPDTHPNVTRVLLGDPAAPPRQGGAVMLETNIDDMDPRLWPDVLATLLAAGASDAWLTPILMKKGRPAHTLSVLCPAGRQEHLTHAVMANTTAIGLRVVAVDKAAAERVIATVSVAGCDIDVKIASVAGTVVNVQPEWEHVSAAARQSGLPVKQILATAHGAAQRFW